MIRVNMHEAKSRLSELVQSAETKGDVIILCRNGEPVAQITPLVRRQIDRLKPHPDLKVKFKRGFDPVEPAAESDWPESAR
jgi:prevent-host-death family protein